MHVYVWQALWVLWRCVHLEPGFHPFIFSKYFIPVRIVVNPESNHCVWCMDTPSGCQNIHTDTDRIIWIFFLFGTIHSLYCLPYTGSQGTWSPSQKTQGGDSLRGTIANTHSHTMDNLDMLFSLEITSLDFWGTKSTQKKPQKHGESGGRNQIPNPWSCETNALMTKAPCTPCIL